MQIKYVWWEFIVYIEIVLEVSNKYEISKTQNTW